MDVQGGDRVLFGRPAGSEVKIDDGVRTSNVAEPPPTR